jgi:tetratricopeptide (TPR) repeat protein
LQAEATLDGVGVGEGSTLRLEEAVSAKEYSHQYGVVVSWDTRRSEALDVEINNCRLAVIEATKAIESSRNTGAAYLARANANFDLGKWLLSVSQSDLPHRFAHALKHEHVDAFQKAVADCTTAIPLLSDPLKAYKCRAAAYFLLKQYLQAVADWTKVVQLEPDKPDNYSNRADGYTALGQYPSALSDRDQFIRMKPKDCDGYLARSGLYEMMGQHQQALADLNHCIEMEPTESQWYLVRAGYYRRMGQRDRADADLQRASGLGEQEKNK